MRILIADHQPATRLALKILLNEEPSLEVVGEAGDGQELLAQLSITRPDLVLLDWELPGESAASLLPVLRQHDGQPRVVVLSGRPEAETAAHAAGVDAFVSKGDPPRRLLQAIEAVRREVQSLPGWSPFGPRPG
jgi:DNA-binding NarL/FixJ family response regulator